MSVQVHDQFRASASGPGIASELGTSRWVIMSCIAAVVVPYWFARMRRAGMPASVSCGISSPWTFALGRHLPDRAHDLIDLLGRVAHARHGIADRGQPRQHVLGREPERHEPLRTGRHRGRSNGVFAAKSWSCATNCCAFWALLSMVAKATCACSWLAAYFTPRPTAATPAAVNTVPVVMP